MYVFTTLHENIPFIIFTNLSCFLAWFFFSFVNRPKESVFLHIERICLYYTRACFFLLPYCIPAMFLSLIASGWPSESASTFPFLMQLERNALIKISDTVHHGLTSSRLENAWRYFCARTASFTYFHISAVELSLTLPDFLFPLPLMIARWSYVYTSMHAWVRNKWAILVALEDSPSNAENFN